MWSHHSWCHFIQLDSTIQHVLMLHVIAIHFHPYMENPQNSGLRRVFYDICNLFSTWKSQTSFGLKDPEPHGKQNPIPIPPRCSNQVRAWVIIPVKWLVTMTNMTNFWGGSWSYKWLKHSSYYPNLSTYQVKPLKWKIINTVSNYTSSFKSATNHWTKMNTTLAYL